MKVTIEFDGSAMRNALNDFGFEIDPNDPDALAQAIKDVIVNELACPVTVTAWSVVREDKSTVHSNEEGR